MDEFEEWLSVDDDVTELILQRDRAGARRLLRESAETAAARKQFDIASHFADQLGSLCAGDRLNDEALSAYLWAEHLSPRDGRHKVSTANFFLIFHGQPADAVRKIDEAVPLLEQDPQTRYALINALAIKAVARLALGDDEYAIAQFREWSSSERLSRVGSGCCDLRLALALWARGILKDQVIAYLQSVLAKAREQGNANMVGEVQRALSVCRSGTNPNA